LNDINLPLYEIILIEEKRICGNAQYEYSVILFIIMNMIDHAVNNYDFSEIIFVLEIIIYFIIVRATVFSTACNILKTLTYASVINFLHILAGQIEETNNIDAINNSAIAIIANHFPNLFL
jgi:hypothetical protein